jgi:hypothetical protein
MGIIELILVAIRGLAVVTNNPALGGGSSVRMQEASELLALLGELLERGDEAHDELVAFTKVVEGMAKQGRAPSGAEWDTLRGRSDAAHATIQDAVADLDAEEKAAEEEEQRLKKEALERDLARLNKIDLEAAADSLGIPTDGLNKAEIAALILEAKLAE